MVRQPLFIYGVSMKIQCIRVEMDQISKQFVFAFVMVEGHGYVMPGELRITVKKEDAYKIGSVYSCEIK